MTGLPLIIDSTARSRPLKFENRIPGPFFFIFFHVPALQIQGQFQLPGSIDL